jgi:hypothetical protein
LNQIKRMMGKKLLALDSYNLDGKSKTNEVQNMEIFRYLKLFSIS